MRRIMRLCLGLCAFFYHFIKAIKPPLHHSSSKLSLISVLLDSFELACWTPVKGLTTELELRSLRSQALAILIISQGSLSPSTKRVMASENSFMGAHLELGMSASV